MSPAHQGNLEVERYIGSYLISQRTPPNVKTSTGSKRYQNHNVNVKPKPADSEKVRNYNKYCFSQRDHHVRGPPRYSMPPPGQIPMPIDCQGYGGPLYGKQNPGGSGWAGVPLISMTSGNHRRNKRIPPATNQQPIQKYNHKQNHNVSKKDVEEHVPNEPDRSPLSRLAMHTQGAPLIQAGRYNNNNRNRNNANRDSGSRVHRSEAARWDTAKDTKAPVDNQNKERACSNTDSLSVASDESSGNSENSLPRIIKPRKRRKKDRKPLNGTNLTSTQNDTSQFSVESGGQVESSSLKSFLPLCFERSATDCNEKNTHDLLSESILSLDEKQNEDLVDPLTSADEFPFGNLLDDEEDNNSELSSCAPVPATLCQCRYCDPSGVIWDVDQRCYSPFLTPPSPTDNKPQFSNSLPLSFDAFNSVKRSYNRQVAIVDPPHAYHSHYSFCGDLGSLLRRSWSEPSSNDILCDSLSQHVEVQGSRPASPVGLLVSSEIVTSPNGHRDIEIKFYSPASSTQESSKQKINASDRDFNERCFVVEE